MESTQTREARSWLAEGISTGSVQSDTVYDIFDADADSTAQGSTRGRTHGIGWDQGSSANASQTTATPPSSKAAQRYAARTMGHTQGPYDAAETQNADSPASVIVVHTATPAVSSAKQPRQLQMTRQASESQQRDLAEAGGQQTKQKQKQMRTTQAVDAPQQAVQPEAAAAATTTTIATAIELALSTRTTLVLDWTGLGGACVLVLGDARPIAGDQDAADAGDDSSPCAEQPEWLEQAWAKLHDKDLVDAGDIAPGTGLAEQFDEGSAAGSPASALADADTSPDIPPPHGHAPALSQVLATGILVDMLVELDTLAQPTVLSAVPPVAATPSGLEGLVAAQQTQLHGAASTIAAAAHAWLARMRLQNQHLRQAATVIAAIRRAVLARRAAVSSRRAVRKRLQRAAVRRLREQQAQELEARAHKAEQQARDLAEERDVLVKRLDAGREQTEKLLQMLEQSVA